MKNKSKVTYSIPSMFEKNIGQHKNEAKFVMRNNNGTVFFLDSEIVYALMKIKEEEKKEESIKDKLINKKDIKPKDCELNLLKMKLENSNKNSNMVGIDEFDCKINYFKGSDASKWTTNIPIYEKVIYEEIYKGIDLVYYENQGALEHDFIVKPNADINNIKITFQGADKIEQDQEGNILISVKDNTVQMLKPKTYQEIGSIKVEIESNFLINNNSIKFNIPTYDKNKTLVIDPTLLYGSYLGKIYEYSGYGIAVDENENAYITGSTYSATEFLLKNAYQGTLKGSSDAFLIKIDTKKIGASSLKYGSYLGGNGNDTGRGVAVDENENAYIAGSTASTGEFPLKNAYQGTLKGYSDAFLIKIDTKEIGVPSLKYGSYLGGNDSDSGWGIAVDENENAYITGLTASTAEFPLKNAYQGTLKGARKAFLIKIDTKEIGVSSLKYGSYLGGNNSDYGYKIAVDENENAYITGHTYSTAEFPLKNAYQGTLKGYLDAFLIKIDTKEIGVSSLKYGSYLGGNNYGYAHGIAVDKNENAYITGYTESTDEFPLKNAYQGTLKGYLDAFLIKIDTKEIGVPSLKYGSYLGGNDSDSGWGIAVDENENAYITGVTYSTAEFPLKNAYQGTLKGSIDAFLIKIDTKKIGVSSLKYGSYLGGNDYDRGWGIAVDKNGNAYITGVTYSTAEFPLKNAYQGTLKGGKDAFLIKINTLECDLVLEESTCACIPYIEEKIPYTIKVTNKGPDKATNIVITDKLQQGLKIDSYNASIGHITNSHNIVTWKIAELGIGESAIAMIVVKTSKRMLCSCEESGLYILNTASLTCDNNIVNPASTTDTTMVYVDCTSKDNDDEC